MVHKNDKNTNWARQKKTKTQLTFAILTISDFMRFRSDKAIE